MLIIPLITTINYAVSHSDVYGRFQDTEPSIITDVENTFNFNK